MKYSLRVKIHNWFEHKVLVYANKILARSGGSKWVHGVWLHRMSYEFKLFCYSEEQMKRWYASDTHCKRQQRTGFDKKELV